jgi:hypothetical protein
MRLAVIEVMRREGSAVELRPAKDPVSRYIEDAMALPLTHGLPVEAARCVVPGLCREALENNSHAEVEALLLKAHKLNNLAALALFDDSARAGDVMSRINKDVSRAAGDTLKACNEGAHDGYAGVLVDFVRDAEKLAGWLQKLK